MLHTKTPIALVLILATAVLPGCGAAALLAPLIEAGIDEIFKDDQKGDQVPDDTPIGEAVDLEISLGGRICCDPANGTNQRVTIVTIRHTGSNDSGTISFRFIPGTDTILSASPATGTLAPGDVRAVEIFADDCDFFVEEFRMRTYFTGDENLPGRSTTTLLTVRNICHEDAPTVDAFLKLLADPAVQAEFATNTALVEYGEPSKHGSVAVPDRVPDIPLSQIGYYGALDVNLDATALDSAFTGGSAAFPVGTHTNGSVYEADTPATMPTGDYRLIFFGVDGVFDSIDTSRYWRFAVYADHDGQSGNNIVLDAQFANSPTKGCDRFYLLDFVPGSGWSVRVLDQNENEIASAVRVIRVLDAVLFAIPKSELPGPSAGFRVMTFTHTGDNGLGPDRDWSGDHHPTPDLADLAD